MIYDHKTRNHPNAWDRCQELHNSKRYVLPAIGDITNSGFYTSGGAKSSPVNYHVANESPYNHYTRTIGSSLLSEWGLLHLYGNASLLDATNYKDYWTRDSKDGDSYRSKVNTGAGFVQKTKSSGNYYTLCMIYLN